MFFRKTHKMIFIPLSILIFSVILLSVLSYADSRKERKRESTPFISFIVPSYNDADTLEPSIKSIYDSYDNFELFVINDGSTDNSYEILNKLKDKYCFNLINNKINIGKGHSINETFKKTKGEIIFIIDSDTILNKRAVDSIISRFDYDINVGGVSCRYKSLNKGFLPRMQDIEYSMLGFTQSAYNIFSTISMWGGCMAFRRRAFKQIGMLSPNFLAEDCNASFKLKDKGWKVEQTNEYIYTKAPDTIKSWYKQKKRWSGGFIQNVIAYPKLFFSNPLASFFMVSYSFLTVLFLYGFFNRVYLFGELISLINTTKQAFGLTFLGSLSYLYNLYNFFIFKKVLIGLAYPLLSLPYMFYDETYRKSLNMFFLFPFSIIYLPCYIFMNMIGFFIGIKKYKKLKYSDRAW